MRTPKVPQKPHLDEENFLITAYVAAARHFVMA